MALAPTPRLTVPRPPATEYRLSVPLRVQAPPRSAEPQPPVTVREKASRATEGSPTTVTEAVVESVAPAPSVTVRRTVYVPSAAYVWLVVRPVPVLPSPKSHA